jgi:hypothetical protein
MLQAAASLGVGLYQAGTKKDAELLYVSNLLLSCTLPLTISAYAGNRLNPRKGRNWM